MPWKWNSIQLIWILYSRLLKKSTIVNSFSTSGKIFHYQLKFVIWILTVNIISSITRNGEILWQFFIIRRKTNRFNRPWEICWHFQLNYGNIVMTGPYWIFWMYCYALFKKNFNNHKKFVKNKMLPEFRYLHLLHSHIHLGQAKPEWLKVIMLFSLLIFNLWTYSS